MTNTIFLFSGFFRRFMPKCFPEEDKIPRFPRDGAVQGGMGDLNYPFGKLYK
ncbi:MAG: hypothetical protein ACLTV2_08050 [Acutalibacter sp.]|jgi:hypothetical protein